MINWGGRGVEKLWKYQGNTHIYCTSMLSNKEFDSEMYLVRIYIILQEVVSTKLWSGIENITSKWLTRHLLQFRYLFQRNGIYLFLIGYSEFIVISAPCLCDTDQQIFSKQIPVGCDFFSIASYVGYYELHFSIRDCYNFWCPSTKYFQNVMIYILCQNCT